MEAKHGYERRHRIRHMRRMRRLATRRGHHPHWAGPERRGMMREFFEENPACAEKLARFGVARLRADGMSDDEIRDHFTAMRARRFLSELDIDSILEA